MKVQVLSDLHLRYYKTQDVIPLLADTAADADVTVIAGDVDCDDWAVFFREMCDVHKMVLFVPGNHDFYGNSIQRALDEWKSYEYVYPNLRVLYNSSELLSGTKFVGTTLWFRKPACGFYTHTSSYPDFAYIENFTKEVEEENNKAIRFLMDNSDSNSVIVSHFVPSQHSTHPKYEGSFLNQYFVCSLDDHIVSINPKLWVHGHTHDSYDYAHPDCNTRVVCNPMGYLFVKFGEEFLENNGFRKNLIVEV